MAWSAEEIRLLSSEIVLVASALAATTAEFSAANERDASAEWLK